MTSINPFPQKPVKNFVEIVKNPALCIFKENRASFQQGPADEKSQLLQGFPRFSEVSTAPTTITR